MDTPSDTTNVSRRAVLGAGLGIVGAGLLAGGVAEGAPAHGAHPTQTGTPRRGVPLTAPVSPLKPELRYLLLTGYDLHPISSNQLCSAEGGTFAFFGGSFGYARAPFTLPQGSVVKEIELYGRRGAAGSIVLQVWRTTVTGPDIEKLAEATAPAVAGEFTLTVQLDDTFDGAGHSTPFVSINAAAAPESGVLGVRIGYVSPTGFVALPPAINPRILDTRQGGTKLAPGEERTIDLPVPAGAAALMTVTLTRTEGAGGYVAVFPAGMSWPGNSSVNFSGPDENVANTVVTAVSADSKVTIRGGDAKTDVIIDVAGWIA